MLLQTKHNKRRNAGENMTRKDYKLIAKAIRLSTTFEYVDDGYADTPSKNHVVEWTDLISYLGAALEKENPKFDFKKFVDACEPQEKEVS